MNVISLGYRGSLAHGTYKADSIDDIDMMGVFVKPIDYYLGINNHGKNSIEVQEGKYDTVYYELLHFIAMCEKNNPNVLPHLWTEPTYEHPAFTGLIRRNRDLFSSMRSYDKMLGYANGQLKKMFKKPTTAAYQGEKRRLLSEKFGYDTKHASHTLRLVTMCSEFLLTGELYVDRRGIDSALLETIKNGGFEKQEVLTQIDRAIDYLKNVKHYGFSVLPDEPDTELINHYTVGLMQTLMKEGYDRS